MEHPTTLLERTPLHAEHVRAGAKLVPFAGYDMPVTYAGLVEEHQAVRNRCGLFDVSHMGEFFLTGPGAFELLQYATSNDVSRLQPGQVQYSCMPNGRGGIVDDVLVYRLAAEEFMLVVNASNRAKDLAWLQELNRWDAHIEDRSEAFALLALQGPAAAEFLRPLTDGPDPGELTYYTFRRGTVCGKPAILSATGYTGAGGFELYVAPEDASEVWRALIDAGVPPCGLGARDTLRLEAGFCLYGNDIDDTTSPIEAGLGWITKFTKDFVDRERLEAQKTNGTDRILRGLRVLDRGIPRHGYTVEDASGQQIGEVTSGTMSPTLGYGIGLAYLSADAAELGSHVFVRVRNNALRAEVVRPGFLPRG
jgi:aminomethyltransferase